MLFVWDEECSVGVSEIDQDHQLLIKLINDLYEATQDGCGGAALLPMFSALKNYTETHFDKEERYMVECNAPDQELHCLEHQQMRDKLSELEERHRKGEAAISLETSIVLRNWLKTHIRVIDRAMAPHLRAKGIN